MWELFVTGIENSTKAKEVEDCCCKYEYTATIPTCTRSGLNKKIRCEGRGWTTREEITQYEKEVDDRE